jgi:hypothetical protein
MRTDVNKREQDSAESNANKEKTSVKVIGLYHRETRISLAQEKYYPLEQAAKAEFFLHLILSSKKSLADQT